MRQKLHAPVEVQSLLNAVMPWAESRLREAGAFAPIAAWLPAGDASVALDLHAATPAHASIPEEEARLAAGLRSRWQRGELEAAALVALVHFGKPGSTERQTAVRLHIETRAGYCADILMPYRIRAGWRWRGPARNRVHFSHPVAQHSSPLLASQQTPTEG